jgi:hypothetical protein
MESGVLGLLAILAETNSEIQKCYKRCIHPHSSSKRLMVWWQGGTRQYGVWDFRGRLEPLTLCACSILFSLMLRHSLCNCVHSSGKYCSAYCRVTAFPLQRWNYSNAEAKRLGQGVQSQLGKCTAPTKLKPRRRLRCLWKLGQYGGFSAGPCELWSDSVKLGKS